MVNNIPSGFSCETIGVYVCVACRSMAVTYQGFFFAIFGRGPRAFQIGKISAVNHYFGKFSKQTKTAFLVSLKTKLALTHNIAIK